MPRQPAASGMSLRKPGLTRRSVLGMVAGAAIARPSIAQESKARVLRFVPSGNLSSRDANTTDGVNVTHARAVFDSLYAIDENFQPRPQMVEGHQLSDDNRVWTFRLREGLKFHDGEPVRSRDCVTSIERWGKRDSFGISLMGTIDRMEATDDRTFKIYLKRPVGPVLMALGHSAGIPLHIMPERLAQTDPFKQIPEAIGSGPYRFVANEYVSGSRVTYARFEGYVPRDEPPSGAAGGKVANFDRVEWHIIPDAATAVSALKAGEVDWLDLVQPDLVPSLNTDSNLTVAGTTDFSTVLLFNYVNPPFSNAAIRRALRDAINQEEFVQAIVGDDPKLYRLCHSMFGCGLPGVIDNPTKPTDLETARKAIKAAGYNGEKVVMLDITDYSFFSSGARIAADLMTRLGMNVDLQSMDFGTMLKRRTSLEPVDKGGWSIFCTGAGALSLQDPGLNYYVRGFVGGYKNEEINRLSDDWFSATKPEDLQRVFEHIQRVAYDDVPMISLGQFKLRTAYRKNLSGVLHAGTALFWNVRRT
jgi:peptide/nickel transport system substrate-binding protein